MSTSEFALLELVRHPQLHIGQSEPDVPPNPKPAWPLSPVPPGLDGFQGTSNAMVEVPLAALGFLGVVSIFLGHEAAIGGSEIGYLVALGSAAAMAFYTVSAGRIVASVADLCCQPPHSAQSWQWQAP